MAIKYVCGSCKRSTVITGSHPVHSTCKCGGKLVMPGIEVKDIVVKK